MGAPVLLPSKTPDNNSTVSDSLRGVVTRDCPGLLRLSSDCIKSISNIIPGGHPSITPPTAVP